MSWKIFWQIVLLIVIAAVIFSVSKVGLLHCKGGYMGKRLGGQHHSMPKGK